MAEAKTAVNVTVDKTFTAAVLRGVADNIPDEMSAEQIRELLTDFADTLENGATDD